MRSKAKLVKVMVKLPWVEGEWVADTAQQTAAWEMYVELVTRIGLHRLPDDGGILREALSSLYAMFAETRRILRAHGPGVATPAAKGALSFGEIAVDVLNEVLRPFLTTWHPQLLAHEAERNSSTSVYDHERKWPLAKQLRTELADIQPTMLAYADLLAQVCGIAALHKTKERA